MRTKWPALVVDDAITFEAHMEAGARFHRLIQQYLLGIPQEHLDALAEADPAPNFMIWWENFLNYAATWDKTQRFVEIILVAPILNYRLLAKYDLVRFNPSTEKLVILDWKTSQKLPKREWLLEKIQTRFYRYVLTQAFPSLMHIDSIKPEKVTMKYWFAEFPSNSVDLPYDQKTFENDRAVLTGLIEEILRTPEDQFLKTRDEKKCRFCVYRSHCDRGMQAGDLMDYENYDLEPEDMGTELNFDEIGEIKF
jgi:hypothetical protein